MKIIRSVLKKFTESKANNNILPIETGLLIDNIHGKINKLEINILDFEAWVLNYQSDALKVFGGVKHKKLLELYISFLLLDIKENEIYLDAAGGKYSYISKLKCREKIIQDINFADEIVTSASKDVKFLTSPADNINLDSDSIDKISCHHSIEHFQENADVGFIKELQRILTPNGKCVIVPLFISELNYLITDKRKFEFWDEKGKIVFDPIAGLPGGERSGNFARIYSISTLHERIIQNIDFNKFDYRIHSIEMDGREIPNESDFYVSNQARINYSYRALEIYGLG